MPPRYQARPTDLLTRVRNEMDALGRPGMAGTSRLGGNRGRGFGQASVVADGTLSTAEEEDGPWAPLAGFKLHELYDAAPLSIYVNNPQAVYDAESDRTYLAWLGAERDCYVAWFAHSTGELSIPVKIGVYPLADTDDHGAPTIAIDLDGYVHVVWGSHGTSSGAAEHRHSKSDNPHGIGSWTTQTLTGGGTYPHLVVADNGDMLLFDRAGATSGSFPNRQFASVRRLTDGWTWTGHAGIIDVSGTPEANSFVYLMGATATDGLVHLTWTVLRGGSGSTSNERTNVYHATYDQVSGTMRNAAGTDLGSSVTWAEHTDCLVHTATPVDQIRHLVHRDGRIFVVFRTGTPDSPGFGGVATGDFTYQVGVWDDSVWTVTDTGIPLEWKFSDAIAAEWADGIILLACTRSTTETRTNLRAWISPDGATFHEAGEILAGTTGEGVERCGPVLGGRLLALVQEMPTAWAGTSATADDLLPVYALEGHPAPSTHGNEHHSTDFGTGDTPEDPVTAAEVRDAGRWEIVVTGNPATAVTTPDGTDWVYGWVTG